MLAKSNPRSEMGIWKINLTTKFYMKNTKSTEIKVKNKHIILALIYKYRFFKRTILTEQLSLSKSTVHSYLMELQTDKYVILDTHVQDTQSMGRIPIKYQFNSEIGFVIVIIDTSEEFSMLITNVYAKLKFRLNLYRRSEEEVIAKITSLSSQMLGTNKGLLGVMHITDRRFGQSLQLDKINSIYLHEYNDDCLASYHFSHTNDQSVITVLKNTDSLFVKFHLRNQKNKIKENYHKLHFNKNTGVMISRNLYNIYQLTDPDEIIVDEAIRPYITLDQKYKNIYLSSWSIREKFLKEGICKIVLLYLDSIS